MAGVPGIGGSFKLDSSGNVLTEIATWLTDIASDASTDKFETTTFQPGATIPIKTFSYGATERTYSLTGNWVAAAETFFSAIDGMTAQDYEYGPTGTASGNIKILGTCAVGAWSGPQQQVSGIITFSIELSLNSRTVTTF